METYKGERQRRSGQDLLPPRREGVLKQEEFQRTEKLPCRRAQGGDVESQKPGKAGRDLEGRGQRKPRFSAH